MLRRLHSTAVSSMLLLALVSANLSPSIRLCEVSCGPNTSMQCCGACCTSAREEAATCCSTVKEQSVCTCLVEKERPATPPERRNSDVRDDLRLAQGSVTEVFVGNEQTLLFTAQDATSGLSSPSIRCQAVLCRWLT